MMQNEFTTPVIIDPGFQPYWEKSDKKAKIFIWSISIIVFVAVAILSKVKLNVHLGFNPHIFAQANALINSTVSILFFAIFLNSVKIIHCFQLIER